MATIGFEEFKAYINPQGSVDDLFIQSCLWEALEHVDNYIGSQSAAVPDTIRNLAIKWCGQAIFDRRDTKAGVANSPGGYTDAPVRVARDPMIAVYPLLNQYLVVGF
jgi:hypothetical protein